MTKPVINVADAQTRAGENGAHFAYSMTDLASALGARAIGANITRIPPGRAAFPLHHHHTNEEHFFILSGSGVLRHGGDVHDVKADDYIVMLPGGADRAHQLVNTGDQELVFLAISTEVFPEVIGYPDSAKTGVRIVPTDDRDAIWFMVADDAKDAVSYWDDEDGARVAALVAERG